MLLTAKLTFFTEKLNFTLLKENDFNYVTLSWKEGIKKEKEWWWPKNDTGSKAIGHNTPKKKKHPLADSKQNSSHHPPGDSNTLAWIERILHGGLLFPTV